MCCACICRCCIVESVWNLGHSDSDDTNDDFYNDLLLGSVQECQYALYCHGIHQLPVREQDGEVIVDTTWHLKWLERRRILETTMS